MVWIRQDLAAWPRTRVVVVEPDESEPRKLWTPAGVRPVLGRGEPVPSYWRQRLPGWLGTRFGAIWVSGLVLAGLPLLAERHAAGWYFIALAFTAAVLPPALFVGLRTDQRRARKRFVASAMLSGILVLTLAVAYGWPAAALGLAIVLAVLAREQQRHEN
jgi:hypothetical protein